MSRDTHSSLFGLPSAPRMGVTCTSHHLAVPIIVSDWPTKCPRPPARAAATAALAWVWPSSSQKSGQAQPRMALKSLTSNKRMPRSLMKVRLASRSSTLMQSPDAASTLRKNSASARCASAACRSPVMSRKILKNPTCAPSLSRKGTILPLPQNSEPSFLRYSRSPSARPVARACFISAAKRWSAWSCRVESRSADSPRMAWADQPKRVSAP